MENEDSSAVCVDNSFYPASLEQGKIYRLIDDTEARKDGFARLVDDRGEDHLYKAAGFVAIDVPAVVKASLPKAA